MADFTHLEAGEGEAPKDGEVSPRKRKIGKKAEAKWKAADGRAATRAGRQAWRATAHDVLRGRYAEEEDD
ncbi:hypothetical protein K2P56_02420 [Patescibacteria group bacterium]|nr:hypothetical protein [Patescibacteria group bacterium]